MNPPLEMFTGGSDVDVRLLDAMQFAADPLADATAARIAGPWVVEDAGAGGDLVRANAARWERLAAANRVLASWTHNDQLHDWAPPEGQLPADIASALADYVKQGTGLPPWADRDKIARAETLFFDYGPLSCILLFCASLPECYVIPDLADVLHAAGQLEQHTDYRIRMTAAMIFPVMMRGGLAHPDGGGVAQILKVRLIHATIRNLILRGRPEDAGDRVEPRALLTASGQMHHALFAHGWNVRERGLPCNQEELAYTLLTFSYVFLRSLRRLGLSLSPSDEEAYLHCWNVAGHVLGIRRDLMADTMADAEALFTVMQARGREHPPEPDVRPGLGSALIDAMAKAIRLPVVRHFPTLMTHRLVGPLVAHELGIAGRAPLSSRLLFAVVMGISRPIDAVVRLWSPEFALSRLVARVLGYHLLSSVLLDQTRPLKLPDHLLNRVDEHMATWGEDRKAPGWINRIEDRLTTTGPWHRRGSAGAR